MKECVTHHDACDCRERKFAEIEAERDQWRKMAERNSIRAGEYAIERDRYREALLWYAEERNYRCTWRPDTGLYVPANSEGSAEIEVDKGSRARQALFNTPAAPAKK